jgi:hypothetical protein
MRAVINACNILVLKPEWKKPLGKHMHILEYNIKMVLNGRV